MASSNKEINKLIKKLQKQDWRIRESKHLVLYPPNSNTIITLSKSPQSGSVTKILKQCRDAGAIL